MKTVTANRTLIFTDDAFEGDFKTKIADKTKGFIKLKLHIHHSHYVDKLCSVLDVKKINVYYKKHYNYNHLNLYTLFPQYLVDFSGNSYVDCLFQKEIHKETFLKLLLQFDIPFSKPINNATHIPARDDTLTGKTIVWNEPVKKTKYPIYIISKGRYTSNLTARFLIKSNIDFKLVVESDEYDLYNQKINEKYLLKVDNYSKLNCGSIPVRNFVFNHSVKNGHSAHWILDDNIAGYELVYKGKKLRCYNSCVFTMVEDFYDLHKNIGMIGHNYSMNVISTSHNSPYTKNCNLYSSMLINNNIYDDCKTDDGIWRGKYNEDVDLNIRCIQQKWNVVKVSTIVCGKTTTKRIKGGNTDTIYRDDDFSYHKTMSLVKQHPLYVKALQKFNRTHHFVNWKKLQTDYPNELKLKDELKNCDLPNPNSYDFEVY